MPPEPAYRRVSQDLRQRIADGRLPAGRMLPGRQAMAREFGVALQTLQRAIEPLLAEGLLRADDRRGTFVAEQDPAAQEPSPSRAGSSASFPPGRTAPATSLRRVAVVGFSDVALDDSGQDGAWVPICVRAMEAALAAMGVRCQHFGVFIDPRHGFTEVEQALDAADEIGAEATVLVDLFNLPGFMAAATRSSLRRPQHLIAINPLQTYPTAICTVQYDQLQAGFQALCHLASQGYRRVVAAHIHNEPWWTLRLGGARLAAEALGIDFHIEGEPMAGDAEHWKRLSIESYAARFGPLLDRMLAAAAPTGLIFPNDGTALPCLQWLRSRGRQAGRDLGVIAFDNEPAGRRADLTTLAPPLADMGRSAARLLLDLATGRPVPRQISLASQLIPRGSTVLQT